jgi:hypothetical protein
MLVQTIYLDHTEDSERPYLLVTLHSHSIVLNFTCVVIVSRSKVLVVGGNCKGLPLKLYICVLH